MAIEEDTTPIRKEKKRRYNKYWEDMPEFKGWLQQSPMNADKAYCKVCEREHAIHMNDLKKHASSSKHLTKLQDHGIDHFIIEANGDDPDYMNTPPIKVKIKQRKSPPITPNSTPRAYNKTGNPVIRKPQIIILNIRVANAIDTDFILIDLPKKKWNYNDLMLAMCHELNVEPNNVERVRLLPHTKLRRDIEVQRLKDYEELELVLHDPSICQSIDTE